MSNCWSSDDKLFVDGNLEVCWFDLKFASSPSESLPMDPRPGAVYDGPKGDRFRGYLSKIGYRVNNKGRVIVAVPQKDEKVEAFHYFLLDKVVPLGPFGFSNLPYPRWKEVMELQSLVDKTEAELAKKNDELNELRQQLEDVKTALMNKDTVMNLEEAKSDPRFFSLVRIFDPPSVLAETNSNFLDFCLRMNRTYVNSEGDYINFEFTAIDSSLPAYYKSSTTSKIFARFLGKNDKNGAHKLVDAIDAGAKQTLYYCDKDFWIMSPIKRVQYDVIVPEQNIVAGGRSIPCKSDNCEINGNPGTWIVNEALGKASGFLHCAFFLGQYQFIGGIRRTSGTFRDNALIRKFFDGSQHGKNCYVDALGTTFFVLETETLNNWRNLSGYPPL